MYAEQGIALRFSASRAMPALPITDDDRAFFVALGERMAQFRKARGITQVQLATTLGVSQQTYQSYEVGRRRIQVSALADENLDLLMTWRETRRVSKSLTVLYDRVLYLLDDTLENIKQSRTSALPRPAGELSALLLQARRFNVDGAKTDETCDICI